MDWTRYLFATQGFLPSGVYSERGRQLRQKLEDMDNVVYKMANNLYDVNATFDREKFLEACGMLYDGYRWSFIPGKEYIKRVRE